MEESIINKEKRSDLDGKVTIRISSKNPKGIELEHLEQAITVLNYLFWAVSRKSKKNYKNLTFVEKVENGCVIFHVISDPNITDAIKHVLIYIWHHKDEMRFVIEAHRDFCEPVDAAIDKYIANTKLKKVLKMLTKLPQGLEIAFECVDCAFAISDREVSFRETKKEEK